MLLPLNLEFHFRGWRTTNLDDVPNGQRGLRGKPFAACAGRTEFTNMYDWHWNLLALIRQRVTLRLPTKGWGHAPRHVSERYIKLATQRDFRLKWAEKIGLGFDLPGPNLGQTWATHRISQGRLNH